MRHFWSLAALSLLFVAAVPLATAQEADEVVRDGMMAFRAGRYDEAARTLERATSLDPDNAQAYFLLARLYEETPLRDEGKAKRALGKALELEPENVNFMVARLQQLRGDTWNFFTEKIREIQRRELAAKILAIDSTNAFAHEELGVAYIRDFWRYRNAIMMPTLRFARPTMAANTNEQDMGFLSPDDQQEFNLDPESGNSNFEAPVLNAGGEILPYNPEEVFHADRFDLEQLERSGVPIQRLSGRAESAYQRAIGHLRQALETDPRRRSIYDEMMEIFALKGEYADAQEMLKEMYSFFPTDYETWLYLGFANYHSGLMDAAAKSFETAFEYMDEPTRQAFSALDHLIPEDEKKAYEADPVTYASRYWTSKDPRYLTPYNERRLEHYARLVYADLLYGSKDLNLRGWDTQRGRILLRYGVPDVDVVFIPSNTAQTAGEVVSSNLDASGGRDPLAENRDPNDPGAFQRRVLAQEGSGFDMAAEANTFNIWDYGDFRFVFEDPFRNGEYRLYSPSATEISEGVHPWLNDYEIRARETFREIPERYEYEAPGRQIDIPYLVNAFRGQDNRTDLYVHFGVPITEEVENKDMIEVTANLGTFLIGDQRDLLVERRRTVYGLRTDQIMGFKEARLWVDTQEIDAPPGHHEVSVEFETASGSVVAVQRRDVEVPDFSSDRLALSDVMLAYHVEETPDGKPLSRQDVVRHGLSITPAPWSVYSLDQPIYLYFEIYSLGKDAEGRTDYEMEALLVPKEEARGVKKFFKGIFGGGEKGVSVTLPGSGVSAEEGQYLILDAQNQETGLYTLLLRVRDNVSKRDVERELDLFLE